MVSTLLRERPLNFRKTGRVIVEQPDGKKCAVLKGECFYSVVGPVETHDLAN